MKPQVEWVTEFPKEDGSYWVKKPTGEIEGPFEVHHEKIWLAPFVGYPSSAIPDKWAFLRCDPDDKGKTMSQTNGVSSNK
jgi:hypothetical protein